jgi:lipoprotein NlpI
MTKWPAPLVRMMLGDRPPEAALAAANDPDATTTDEQVCEANFYTAEFLRLQHRDEEALRLYRSALSGCPHDFIEYTAATNALRVMGKAP